MHYNQYNPYLEAERIYFVPLDENITDDYLRWINDKDIVEYLEVGVFPRTRSELANFVKDVNDSNSNVFFAVIEKDTQKYIGNIKLGPIDWINRTGTYGRIIGDKSCWGKGYGGEMAKLMLRYAFMTLNLNKVSAGALADNLGSIKSNERIGLKREGTLRQHVYRNGVYQDVVLMGITRDEYLAMINGQSVTEQL